MQMRYLILGLAICIFSGCMHTQLRNNSANEAWSAGNMEQQQVLDNLAMFVANPNAMPYFSFPNQSAASVQDTGNAGVVPGFGRSTVAPLGAFWLSSLGLSFSAQRQQQEGFTITPVNDPRKLELMRCAYQQAVGRCCGGGMSTTCPDCQTRFKVFYTGDPDGDIRERTKGIVTTECLKKDGCWFHVACAKCYHRYSKCCAVGHYCGVYVCVPPEGRDELTKLTLAILDFAIHDPPQQITKTVVYYIDEYGLPTVQRQAVGQVTASIGVTERTESLLSTPRPDQARIEQFLDKRLRDVRQMLAATQDSAARSSP